MNSNFILFQPQKSCSVASALKSKISFLMNFDSHSKVLILVGYRWFNGEKAWMKLEGPLIALALDFLHGCAMGYFVFTHTDGGLCVLGNRKKKKNQGRVEFNLGRFL
jgi:hypothetical protein